MTELKPIDLIAYLSIAILLFTTSVEVIRRLKDETSDYVAPIALGGQSIAAIGLTVHNVLAHNVLYAVLTGSVGVFAIVGVLLTLADRQSWRDLGTSTGLYGKVPARSLSIVVRPGETLGSSKDFHRAIDVFRSSMR